MNQKHLLGRSMKLFLGLVLLPAAAWAQTAGAMPAEKTVKVYGQTIHYFEQGQGPNLIFVHGLGARASIWSSNIGMVSAKYHVYALDQIGFGNSAKPLINYRIETFVDFLQGFMKALGIPRATLVGNSLGGWIAADFAAQHPEMVDKLVLVNAAGLPSTRTDGPKIDLNPSSFASMRRIFEFIVYDKQIVTDDIVEKAFEGHLEGGDGYTIQTVLNGIRSSDQYETGKLTAIRAPTLVLWGHDDLIPLEIGERFAQGIAGAKLVVLDRCGHIPQFEKPAEFNRALLGFLDKN